MIPKKIILSIDCAGMSLLRVEQLIWAKNPLLVFAKCDGRMVDIGIALEDSCEKWPPCR